MQLYLQHFQFYNPDSHDSAAWAGSVSSELFSDSL